MNSLLSMRLSVCNLTQFHKILKIRRLQIQIFVSRFILASTLCYGGLASGAIPSFQNPDTSKLPLPIIPYQFGNEALQSPLFLNQPQNVTYKVEFDAQTGNYLVQEMIGERKIGAPKVMSGEEFANYRAEKSMRDFWRQKLGGEGDSESSGFLPKLQVGGESFDRIFGSNVIEIIPQGNAELIFGITRTKTDNAALPQDQQKNIAFDFKSQLQVNVTGKIGEKLGLEIKYDTKQTFDFETNVKVEYTGFEDEIIQKIEAGNVSLPLPGTLITGSQSLFGLKTQLKFGKLDVTSVFSRQNSETQTVEIKGGAQVREFEVSVDQYDANRHFFLSHYFRDNYDKNLQNLPIITSGVTITKLDVWVTNKQTNLANSRNIIGFIDLGESGSHIYNTEQVESLGTGPSRNDINSLYQKLLTDYSAIRDVSQISNTMSGKFTGGYDYEKIESARKLTANEYTFNPQLGFISLTSALNSDEVLAVAYEYTFNGQVYKVGELSTDGVAAPQTLIVKLLKGTNHTPSLNTWDLMMKNVYSLNAYQISPDEFRLDVLYQDDASGSAINYIPEGKIAKQALIRVLNLDNTNSQLDAGSDGVFDFIEGVTIKSSAGKIIFPVLEPFGSYLAQKIGDKAIAEQYVFQELYDSTLTKARQVAEKNKFLIAGTYKSESGSEIFLNASNIPKGSVVVTAGGVPLVEDVQYIVDYNLGSVRIIDEGLLESGTPIKVSVESNTNFSMQTKSLLGAHFNYNISDNFNVGATILHLTERPMTQKVSYGSEAISNTIWGLNTSFRTDAPFLTRAIDFLPFIQTKEKSTIAFDAEFAQLFPGTAKATEGSVYVDDFEGSSTSIDVHSWIDWRLASTPQMQDDKFPEATLTNDLAYGYNRARFAWYTIDPLFLRNTSLTPSYIRSNKDLQSNHFVREIFEKELYPNRQSIIGTQTNISVLNLAFYPNERGPYNYDNQNVSDDGKLLNPQNRWGGIMRNLTTTDFETSNIEYIEFWMMDPFVYDSSASGGDFYINLGNISEDVLRDGRMSFENGLPTSPDMQGVDTSAWGRMPTGQFLNIGFDNDASKRNYQDIGLDGLGGTDLDGDGIPDEYSFFKTYVNELRARVSNDEIIANAEIDPSSDDFKHYLDGAYDSQEASILDRYKYFNNPEGNSSVTTGSSSRQSYSTPDVEELGSDNTMNESEAYYQYHISLRPADLQVGKNFITNKITYTATLANNQKSDVSWFQFKVPIQEFSNVYGTIDDFTSIRFMRLFMRGFTDTVIVRLATLDLVRGEWRKYSNNLIEGQEGMPVNDLPTSQFDIASVNIEENDQRSPVNYVLPPGVSREQDATQQTPIEINEQAMEYRIIDLADGDARASYKTMRLDMRHYRYLRMFVHAEMVEGYPLNDNELTAFIRLGSDYTNNYYEYEIPLKLTPHRINYTGNDADRRTVWPDQNTFNIRLENLTDAKLKRNEAMRQLGSSINYNSVFAIADGQNRIKVTGNPNLGNVKVVMLGVRNPAKGSSKNDDGLAKSVIVWLNELRLTNFEDQSGWAANASMTARLADLGTLTLSGSIVTAGFGALDAKVSARSLENLFQYNLSSSLDMGKFFPQNWNVRIPLFFTYGESFSNPQYNPFDPDVELRESLKTMNAHERDSIRNLVQEYARTKSLNFTNIKLDLPAKKPHFWNPANFAITYSFSDYFVSNYKTIRKNQQNQRLALSYNYNRPTKYISPFKKIKFLNHNALRLIRDFNFSPLPSQIAFRTELSRSYFEQLLRNVNDFSIMLNPTYSKDFLWTRNFTLNWDLSQTLKFDFKSSNTARIDEPDGMVDRKRDKHQYEIWRDSVVIGLKNLGRNTLYNHQFGLTYQIPINKLPFLDWMNATARYTGNYNWQAGAVLADTSQFDFGNIIQNSSQLQFSGQINLISLFNKSNYLREVNQRFDKLMRGGSLTGTSGRSGQKQKGNLKTKKYEAKNVRIRQKSAKIIEHNLNTQDIKVTVWDKKGNQIPNVQVEIKSERRISVRADKNYDNCRVLVEGKVPAGISPLKLVLDGTLRLIMGIKNISLSFTRANGTLLPGFKGNAKFLGNGTYNGQLAPGVPFSLGWQDNNILLQAKQNGWLTLDTTFNSPVMFTQSDNLNMRATIEPFPSLKITLSASRSKSINRSEYFNFNANTGTYNSYQPVTTGNFSISVLSLKTTFNSNAKGNSKAFETLKANRETIAKRLNDLRVSNTRAGYVHTPSNELDEGQFPLGYSELSPEVMRTAFLAAYTGQSPASITLNEFPKIPMPNWQVTFDGLAKLAPLKKIFRSISINHGYSSVYTIGAYTSNVNYVPEDDGFSYALDLNGDFIPRNDITNAAITEQFRPLVGIDVSMQNSFTTNLEMNTGRTLAMSFANNQLTEVNTKEYIVGVGYRFEDLPLIFQAEDGGKKQIKSDLRLTLDFSIRDNSTVLRKLVEGSNDITAGQRINTIKFSADYRINQQVSLTMYFNRVVNKPHVSTTFLTSNTSFGFSVKFELIK